MGGPTFGDEMRSDESRMKGQAISVSLLTGGGDKPYVFGLATALIALGTAFDLIGSDELDIPEVHNCPAVNFLNLRGDQRPNVSVLRKCVRILVYYCKLIVYAATAKPRVFHILWNNKVEWFDRTLLMIYYRILRKKTVLTIHNVNAGTRDSNDSLVNRLTLRMQYALADHMFVHTDKMKAELVSDFGVGGDRVTVIPFGINNAVPNTSLTSAEARRRLGIGKSKKTILFFGNLAPYKGIEYLVAAFKQISARNDDYKLVIGGSQDIYATYWQPIKESLREDVEQGRIIARDKFIPDEETEIYFKAADVLVLPYKHVYQSGVLFLGHSFGLPAIVADVGSLKDDIVEGETGFVFRPQNANDLAEKIERYFGSELYADLNRRRSQIRDFASARHSWEVVAQMTMNVYAGLAGIAENRRLESGGASGAGVVNLVREEEEDGVASARIAK